MEKSGVTQTSMINDLLKIGHGDLSIYSPTGFLAAEHEPELLAHLIAWNHIKGEVRDSKKALPVLSLRGPRDFHENAAAHLALLPPRDLVKAFSFHKALPSATIGASAVLKHMVQLYLRTLESNYERWKRTALQHRRSLKTLYRMNHVAPADFADAILFKRKFHPDSIFAKLKLLKEMPTIEIMAVILNEKIPFLVVVGALGARLKEDKSLQLVLIESATRNELLVNAKMLERWGVMQDEVLVLAYRERLKAKPKGDTLKASKALEHVSDSTTRKVLKYTQEESLDTKKIDGNWLVLADRSLSMQRSIEVAKHVAAFLARVVSGKVYLVAFNTAPISFDVTNSTLDEIQAMLKHIYPSDATSIGCGLDWALEHRHELHGIAICSDGGENTDPSFSAVYKRYTRKMGIEPTVYLWHVPGDRDALSSRFSAAGFQLTKFELGANVDYYSIPNLASSMRSNRYSLVDEIMETPLLTFNKIYRKEAR